MVYDTDSSLEVMGVKAYWKGYNSNPQNELKKSFRKCLTNSKSFHIFVKQFGTNRKLYLNDVHIKVELESRNFKQISLFYIEWKVQNVKGNVTMGKMNLFVITKKKVSHKFGSVKTLT